MPKPADALTSGTEQQAIARVEHPERVNDLRALKPRERRELHLFAIGYRYSEIMPKPPARPTPSAPAPVEAQRERSSPPASVESSPGRWCRSSTLRSSVNALAAQAGWSSGTSSLMSLLG
jgi:hypothetical protein